MITRWIASVAGLCMLLTACASTATQLPTQTAAQSTAQPTAQPTAATAVTATPTSTSNALQPVSCRSSMAPSGAQCYDLTVPEHHKQPGKRTLRLHVAVIKSTSSKRAEDPILFLMGGPGAPGIASYGWTAGDFAPFHGRRDIIVLDQRGTGDSVPTLLCPEYGEFLSVDDSKQLPADESLALELGAYRKCHDRLVGEGVDPTAYNSAEVAGDVEALRRALGIQSWNLYGWSYGARVALTVMRDYTAGIRSVVLDSPVPPHVDSFGEAPKAGHAVLARIFERCVADAACNAAFPKLEQAFYQLLEDLDAKPAQIGSRLITGDKFLDLVLSLLYDSSAILNLPKLIYTASQGDYALLGARVNERFGYDNTYSDGMQLSTLCAEELRFSSTATVAAGTSGLPPRLAEYFVTDAPSWFGICEFWDTGSRNELENVAVASDVPTLLLVGDFDAATPPEWARRAATTLSKSQVAAFTWLSHGLFRSDQLSGRCVSQLVDHFLDTPLQKLDMSCVKASDALPRRYIAP
jgi:pimeloyl-ACP methyl ester carboxylesterase